jgi:hypothetical protein
MANSSDDVPAKGGKYITARNSLPEPLWPIYKDFVEQYKFYALARYGRAWVAYDVVADLVRAGWRDVSSSTDQPSQVNNDDSESNT